MTAIRTASFNSPYPHPRHAPAARKLVLALALCFGAGQAFAVLPTGQTVVQGAATVTSPNANSLQVNVSTNKAVLNWTGFSISNGNSVQFVQPNSSAVVLNRVTGSSASDISGALSANGQVFLVNPNGIFFGATARVDVGGLVASTLDISDNSFMNGDYSFSKVGGSPLGQVVNNGSINIAPGGYAAMIGEQVTNGATGVISAPGGKIALLGGEGVTLNLGGDQLLSFTIPQAALDNAAMVQNSGQLLADGGSVNMAARVANMISGAVVNQSGVIRAQGVAQKNGEVYLSAEGGDIEVSGSIDVGALSGNTASAVLAASGGSVNLRNGASINVNGDAGATLTLQSSNQVNLAGDVLAQSGSGVANINLQANGIGLGSANVAATGYMVSFISVAAGQGGVSQNTDGQLRALTSATEQQVGAAGGGAFAGIMLDGAGTHNLGGLIEAHTTGPQALSYVSLASSTGSVNLGQVSLRADGSGTGSDLYVSAAGSISSTGTISSSAGAGPATVTMSAGTGVTLGADLTVSGVSGTDRATLAAITAGSGDITTLGAARISVTDTTTAGVASNGAGLGLAAYQGNLRVGDITVTSAAGPAQGVLVGATGVSMNGDITVSGQSSLINIGASGADVALASGKTVLALSTTLGGGGALLSINTPGGTLHIDGTLRAQAPGSDSAVVVTNPVIPPPVVTPPDPGSPPPVPPAVDPVPPVASAPVVIPPAQSVLTRLLNLARSASVNPLSQSGLIVMPAWNIVTPTISGTSTFDSALFDDDSLPAPAAPVSANPVNSALKK